MTKGKEFISQLKLYSDYLKWDEELGRYETWEEACEKVLNTHKTKYGTVIDKYIDEVRNPYYNKEVLASQRNLQFRGDSIFKHNSKIYNCCVAYAYSPDVFNKGFYVLLSGCGLGISLKKKYVNQLPKINKRNEGTKTFTIPDSIEGWSESIKVLISSYCKHPSLYSDYFGYGIKFDYSEIRPKGAFISGGFKAPGYEGLKLSIENIELLINNHLNGDDSIDFKSIIVYDILMHISDAVLSGGVRRSAMNVLIDMDDEEMMKAKTGDWRTINPQRARSNNSVGLMKGQFSKETLTEFVGYNKGDNDIGFVFMNHEDENFNPCISDDNLVTTPSGLFRPSALVNNENIILNGVSFKAKPFRLTGIHPILEIETQYGRKIKVTPSHLVLDGVNETFRESCTFEIGDKIVVTQNKRDLIINEETNDFKIGYLLGSFLGDGNFSKNTCEIKFWGDNNSIYHNKVISYLSDLKWLKSNHKTLTEDARIHTRINTKDLYNFIETKDSTILSEKRLSKKLMEGSFDYISGIISGYFDADGTVLTTKEKGNSLRISSISEENLINLQIGLNSLGIYSKIYKNRQKNLTRTLPDGMGGKKEYLCQPNHELIIVKESIKLFNNHCKILNIDKKQKIDGILKSYKKNFYKTNFIEEIVSIKELPVEEVYDCEVQTGIEAFDCNGIIVHNCFEIGFNFYDKIYDKNESVYQFCNLVELNASACVDNKGNFSEQKFYELCRASAILGTLQAGYTNFPYLGKQTEEIVKGEALLGSSITGWMTRPELFNREILIKGANIIKETNSELSKIIGINEAARVTTVKPSGNSSVILKTSSGIHPEHSKRYFRIMQLNKDSETAKYLEKNFPSLIEESKWSSTNSDYVVYSPCENQDGTFYKSDMQGVKHLKLIDLVQSSWINAGKREDKCYNKETTHNVSNTIIIDNEKDIIDYIYDNQEKFAAVSFISLNGDKEYVQAPFTSVLSTEELVQLYGDGVMFMAGLIVDGLHYFDDDLWTAVSYVLDDNKKLTGDRDQVLLRKDWVRRVKKYARNYFKGDLQRTIYCMKDVHLWHKWKVINREFKLINFNEILSKPKFEDISKYGAISCSGGSCEIVRL